MEDFDLTTRLGRVQAAWWLREQGAPGDVLSPEQRHAYRTALYGDSPCDVNALRSLIERYREGK